MTAVIIDALKYGIAIVTGFVVGQIIARWRP